MMLTFLFVVIGISLHWCDANQSTGCSKPPPPIGGKILPLRDLYEVGSSVSYKCNNDGIQHLFGHASRVCTEDGKWSGKMPYCVSKVAHPQDNENSTLLFDGDRSTCINIDKMKATQEIMGQYKTILIRIVGDRISSEYELSIVNKGSFTMSTPFKLKMAELGEDGLYTILFFFNNGSVLNDAQVLLDVKDCKKACKMCTYDIFIDKFASCNPLPPEDNLTSITFHNGNEDFKSFGYGSAAVYSCRDGYTLVGQEIHYCNENNEWIGEDTFCEKIRETNSSQKKIIIIVSGTVGFILVSLVILSIWLCRRNSEKKVKEDHKSDHSENNPSYVATQRETAGVVADYINLHLRHIATDPHEEREQKL